MLAAILVGVLAAAVPASAKGYTVGDSSGWTTGVDYNAWAKGKTFNVGDTLLFQYSGVHSVAEVSAADHGACSARNPLVSYKDQSTIITLTKAGARYFICGTSAHCGAGMKLAVTVAAVSGGSDGSAGTARASAKPSSPGEDSPLGKTTPVVAVPGVMAAKSSSNTSGATGSWAHLATCLVLFAAASLALAG